MIKINSKGFYIASKATKIPMDLSKTKLTQISSIKTYDEVIIKNKNNPEETIIKSFRDSQGNLIRRDINKNGDNKYTIYQREKTDNDLSLQKVSLFVNPHLPFIKERRETLSTKTINNKPVISKTKIEEFSNSENKNITYAEYKNGEKPKFANINFDNNNGNLKINTINSQNVNIDNLKKDPYLLIRQLNGQDFIKAASKISEKDQKIGENKITLKIKQLSKNTYGNSVPLKKQITMNEYYADLKPEMIDTLNHEYRHAYQDSIVKKYLTCKSKTKKEKDLARKFIWGNITYPLTIFDKFYWKNSLETDTRNAGKKAIKKYQQGEKKILEEFPNMTPKQTGTLGINELY